MSNFFCQAVSVSTTPTTLGNYGNQGVPTVKNTGSNTVLIGRHTNANLTDPLTAGYPLSPGESVVLPPGSVDDGYGDDPGFAVAATLSGTSTVIVFGEYRNV